jgi:predicted nucleic acid-binding protein
MPYALLDSNIYIDHWERGAHTDELDEIRHAFIVRHSAVVLSELRRGAHSVAARRTVDALRRHATIVWAPSAADWWRAGELVQKLGARHDWDARKKRDIQNDALIALTAVQHGATVVTSNAADFDLLARELPLRALILRAH